MGIQVNIEIIEKDAIRIMGKTVRAGFWRIGIAMMFHLMKLDSAKMHERIPDKVDENTYYGINIDFNKKKGIVSYMFGAEVHTFKNTPSDMETRTIPASKYVKLRIAPKDEEIVRQLKVKGKPNYGNMSKAGYEYLEREWLPASAYQRAELSENFELYLMDELQDAIYVCIPIVKKQTT